MCVFVSVCACRLLWMCFYVCWIMVGAFCSIHFLRLDAGHVQKNHPMCYCLLVCYSFLRRGYILSRCSHGVTVVQSIEPLTFAQLCAVHTSLFVVVPVFHGLFFSNLIKMPQWVNISLQIGLYVCKSI